MSEHSLGPNGGVLASLVFFCIKTMLSIIDHGTEKVST